MNYHVYIYEQPYCYKVKANDKDHAELIALNIHNGGYYENIYKTEVIKLVKKYDKIRNNKTARN